MRMPVVKASEKPRDPTTFFHLRLRSRRNGKIYPRCGVTVRYGDDPNSKRPVLHIAFCSPMDNYSKAKGRKLCNSCAEDGNPNTRIDLDNEPVRGRVSIINEEILLQAIDKHWQHQLYEWAKAGTVLGPKKHHNPPNWMYFELVLTKKKRKAKAEKKTKVNGKKRAK